MGNTNLVGCLPDTLDQLSALQSLLLHNNYLSGPFPEVLGHLSELIAIDLSDNYFSSTIPASLTSLTKLEFLDLGENFLTASLPDSIGNMISLKSLFLQYNALSGSLPTSLGDLSNLSTLIMEQNWFSQDLPASIGNLHNLLILELRDNRFTGLIPDSYSELRKLSMLDLADNLLSGTIPLYLGTFPDLSGIGLFINYLTGTIPNNLQNLSQLLYFECSYNHITGTIPNYFGTLKKLGYLFMYNNHLTGTIPESLSHLRNLADVLIYSNLLTGSIPRAFTQLSGLRVFMVSNNKLTGNIDVFDPEMQPHLETLVLNNNQFTGTLPAALFGSQSLTVFSAVSNCFHGTLPSSVCDNENLVTLVLDGLSSATSCRDTLFPSLSTTYLNTYTVSGTVPVCLFHLPNLSTLHLSGNGFTGKLPSDLTVGPAMYDLTLSHNQLSGHIPPNIQQRIWFKLDLSYNRFDGALRSDFSTLAFNFSIYRFVKKFGIDYEDQYLSLVTNDPYYISNITYILETKFTPAVTLENNRLSGRIPHSILDLQHVSVLGTNLFSCKLDRSGLPQHDSDTHTYQCGSTAFDIPYYLWLGLCALLVAVILGVVYRRDYFMQNKTIAHLLQCIQEWSSFQGVSLIEHSTLYQLTQLMNWFYKFTSVCICYILFVLSPVYVILSHLYGIMRYEYAWSISGAFISGTAPGVVLFILWTGLVALVLCLGRLSSATSAGAAQSNSAQESHPVQYRKMMLYVTYIAVNLTVVGGVNSLYVYIAIYQSNTVLVLAQILLSFFKLGWNNICTSRLLHYSISMWTDSTISASNKEVSSGYFSLQVLVALLNNIVVPCAVVLVISPNCFYNVFVPAPKVTASYVFDRCSVIETDDSCSQYAPNKDTSSYDPPFTYSYQCSSSLVTYYSPAFLIMCIVSTFVVPSVQSVMMYVYHRNSTVNSVNPYVLRFVEYVSPRILRLPSPAASTTTTASTSSDPLPHRTVFNLSVVLTNLLTFGGLLLTFGVVFPPLAVAIAVTVWASAYFTQLKVGRYVCKAMELGMPQLVAALEADCRVMGSVEVLVHNAVWMIAIITCCFYTLFLFDTLGDAEGFHQAIWVLVVMPLMPMLLWGLWKSVEWVKTGGMEAVGNKKNNNRDIEMEMTDSNVISNPIVKPL